MSDWISISVAEYDAVRQRLLPQERLTNREDRSSPVGWTNNSTAVVFVSEQNGRVGIYRQAIGSATPDVLVSGLSSISHATVAADGSVLFSSPASGDAVVTRVVRDGATTAPIWKGRLNGLACPATAGRPCIVGEVHPGRNEVIFLALTPDGEETREVGRIQDPSPEGSAWALSLDGNQIALFKPFSHTIRFLSFRDHRERDLSLAGEEQLRALSWAADNHGLFASIATQDGAALVRISLNGKVHRLWTNKGLNAFVSVRAAPDRRHLAIGSSRQTINLWEVHDF